MFYANNIRGFLSSRKELYISRFYLWGHARIDPPKILKNKNTFCQVSVYTKANDGKKEIGSTYSFIVVCCQYWLAWQDLTSPPRLFLSHRSCVLSQRDSRYWYCNNSHTTVSAEYTLSIRTLSTLLYLLLFLTARCINSPVSKHVTI